MGRALRAFDLNLTATRSHPVRPSYTQRGFISPENTAQQRGPSGLCFLAFIKRTWITLCPVNFTFSAKSMIVILFFNISSGPAMEKERAPTPVLLPRESHGQRSLAGYSSWGRKSQTRLSNCTTTKGPAKFIFVLFPFSFCGEPYLAKYNNVLALACPLTPGGWTRFHGVMNSWINPFHERTVSHAALSQDATVPRRQEVI